METRMNEVQLMTEQDVLGAMLVNGDMTNALLKDLHAQDFRFTSHRSIFQAMKNLQQYGKFDTIKLLIEEEKGKQNIAIINLMEDALPCNIDTSSGILELKCQWLLEQAQKRCA